MGKSGEDDVGFGTRLDFESDDTVTWYREEDIVKIVESWRVRL